VFATLSENYNRVFLICVKFSVDLTEHTWIILGNQCFFEFGRKSAWFWNHTSEPWQDKQKVDR